MKTIDTLVHDILELVDKGGDVRDSLVQEFSSELANIVKDRLGERPLPRLRLSNLGTKCDRKLWLEVNFPETMEPLSPETRLKFLIGDIHEAVLLFLAKAAGHEVEGTQDTIDLEGVSGHRDAVVSGLLLDVKSASSRSFVKFKEGLKPDEDAFGYLVQLGSYLAGSQDDPKVKDKTKAAFLASDKTLGKLTLDVHEVGKDLPTAEEVRALALQKQEMLASETIPERGFEPVPHGKSGNMALPTYCKYCSVKYACHPGLTRFDYASGPEYFTTIKREPKVSRREHDPF